MRRHCLAYIGPFVVQLTLLVSVASAQITYQVVTDFTGTSAKVPISALLKASDGNYYGTTNGGGDSGGFGTIFRMTPAGVVTVMHSFDQTDGSGVQAKLIEGPGGYLYGTTGTGGAAGVGTIFRISLDGEFTLLKTLRAQDPTTGCYPDGAIIYTPLLEGTDGLFYGTLGSANCSPQTFRISSTGTYELIPGPTGAGAGSGLIRATDGWMYGVTYGGAGSSWLYRIDQSGGFELVHAVGAGGAFAHAHGELVQASDGMIYGTTRFAGAADSGGTIFQFDPVTSAFATVYSSFNTSMGDNAGGDLLSGVIEGSDGWLYGKTAKGGPNNLGTLFRFNRTTFALQVLHVFAEATGAGSFGELIEESPGVFLGPAGGYGPRLGGGGVIFRLTVPPPNLQIGSVTAPASAAAGTSITIKEQTRNVGTGLAAATTTQLWFSTDKILGGDLDLGGRSVPELAAGAKNTLSRSVALPDVAPGTYYLIFQADALGEQSETNETDNLKVKMIVIGPDLVLKSVAFAPEPPTSTAPATVTVTIRNEGGAVAGPSVTRLYRSANARLDATDVALAEVPLGPLAAGATFTHSIDVTFPAGIYYILAVIDDGNVVAEAKETNNLKAAKKTIQ